MKRLELQDLDRVERVARPDNTDHLTVDSPALSVFTDFRRNRPFTLRADTRAVEAEELMLRAHVKMKLVEDQDGRFMGVISQSDLSDDRIREAASGESRHEVRVEELMVPKSLVKAFSYQDLERATIQDVLDALQQNALQQHCLVLDTNNQEIRGLISAGDIARKLHLPLSLHEAPSFSQLFMAASAAPGSGRELGQQ